jgi:hypothetical protein
VAGVTELFFEKKVGSFPRLVEELGLLDLDSGVRTFGDYRGKRRLVFVTRSPHDTYTLMVYENKGSAAKPAAGERLLVKDFREMDGLVEFLRGLLSRPVKAFVY